MRALAWVGKLLRNKRGNVLAITAASMPLIIGGAAMAIDSIQLSVWKRQLQRAADSAAIAGAYADARDDNEFDAVHRDLEENIFPTLSEAEDVEVGPRLGFNRTVYVRLTAQRTVPFMSFFTNSATTITAEATAALADEGEFCLLSLYDGEDPGIEANGNANIDLACGAATNSESDTAVTAGGSSSIIATPISAVGGIDGDNENFGGDTTLLPYSAPVQDPFASVPDPVVETSCDPLSVANGETIRIDAADEDCYGMWDINPGATLELEPGVYYINGGDIDLKGTLRSIGTGGVTIVLTDYSNGTTDTTVDAGDFIQNATGTLDVDGSTTGPYAGIAIYRDRRAPWLEVKINGGAFTEIQGALYMPSSDLWLGGNASVDSTCLQVVAQKIKFQGDTGIENNCEGTGYSMLHRTVVRLVG